MVFQNFIKLHIWHYSPLVDDSHMPRATADWFFRISLNRIFGSPKAYFCIEKNFRHYDRLADHSRVLHDIADRFFRMSRNRIFRSQNANFELKKNWPLETVGRQLPRASEEVFFRISLNWIFDSEEAYLEFRKKSLNYSI